MRIGLTVILALAFTLGSALPSAEAQRGRGDPSGIAREAVQPDVVSLAGKVLKVETAPCEMTTGRSIFGTHFVMKTVEGKKLNIHLGPAAVVEFVAKQLKAGSKVKVEGFRTEKMPEAEYVAKSLTLGERTITLRDETLRPVWAGGGRGWRGRGDGFGWGRGPGWGRRAGYGYGWQPGRAGRGPGWCPWYGTNDWLNEGGTERPK
jgi:hypothetical protein